MRRIDLKSLALNCLLLLASWPALAELPKRDLIVEMRELDADTGAAYTVGTQASQPLLAPQQVRVRNGEKANLSVGRSMPLQWLASASVQDASLSSSGGSARSSGASLTNAVTWMDSGQSIKLQPNWPGAQQAVRVEIDVSSARVEDHNGAELPTQARRQMVTTVSAPMGQWVSIAFTGKSAESGVYRSDACCRFACWHPDCCERLGTRDGRRDPTPACSNVRHYSWRG